MVSAKVALLPNAVAISFNVSNAAGAPSNTLLICVLTKVFVA